MAPARTGRTWSSRTGIGNAVGMDGRPAGATSPVAFRRGDSCVAGAFRRGDACVALFGNRQRARRGSPLHFAHFGTGPGEAGVAPTGRVRNAGDAGIAPTGTWTSVFRRTPG